MVMARASTGATVCLVLAYALAPHEDVAFLELKTLLAIWNYTIFTDGWALINDT